MRNVRGYTLIEVTIASAVFMILASAGLVGGRAHMMEIGRSFDDLSAGKAAASRLEVLSDPTVDLSEGERSFDVGCPGATGIEHITVLSPGLFEVRVRVTSVDGAVSVELTTLLAREEPR